MNKKLALLAILVVAALALAACGGGGGAAAQTVEVTIKAEDIKYDLPTITAKVGQPVKINLQNVGALEHSLIIEALNVRIEKVQAGQTGTATFTPNAAGTYDYICDVPGHKEAGMVGKLVVNP